MEGLEARLTTLAAQERTTTYGALAGDLGLEGPGTIFRLTTALEALMEQDAAARQPLRAALVVARTNAGLPARGFFDRAAALGYDVSDPVVFHETQLRACFAQISP